jgi:hypothetical protein
MPDKPKTVTITLPTIHALELVRILGHITLKVDGPLGGFASHVGQIIYGQLFTQIPPEEFARFIFEESKADAKTTNSEFPEVIGDES